MAGVKAIPDGFRSITPHLVVKNGQEAINFYKKAFGAEEVMVMPGPGGGLMHGEIRIGDSIVMLADEWPNMHQKSPKTLNGSTVVLNIYTPDCDATFDRATKAGATPVMPPTNMFWGDRYSQVQDPFGHVWSIATHVEDVAPDQCARRMQEAFSKPGACG